MCKGKRISEPICNVLKKFESIRTGHKRKISFEIVLKKEKKQYIRFNPFIHNVEKWPTYFKSIFGNFSTLCTKVLKKFIFSCLNSKETQFDF